MVVVKNGRRRTEQQNIYNENDINNEKQKENIITGYYI